jgi:ligand-binding sensor domain-containing protein
MKRPKSHTKPSSLPWKSATALPEGSDGQPPALSRALIALSTLTLLLGSLPALALDKSLDLSQYSHTAWTFRSGFLNGAVYAIAQTRDGYLWLGTQSGVASFDGVRAAPLVLPRGQELPSTAVGALLAARDGTLWIGTFDGLASWNNGRLTEYPALAHQRPVPNSQAFTLDDHGAGAMVAIDSVYQLAGEKFVNYPLKGAPSPLNARTLLRDRRGGLWIGTRANGIVHSYEGKTFLVTISRSIVQNHGGRLWATPNTGPGTSLHFTLPTYQGEESNAGTAAV